MTRSPKPADFPKFQAAICGALHVHYCRERGTAGCNGAAGISLLNCLEFLET